MTIRISYKRSVVKGRAGYYEATYDSGPQYVTGRSQAEALGRLVLAVPGLLKAKIKQERNK